MPASNDVDDCVDTPPTPRLSINRSEDECKASSDYGRAGADDFGGILRGVLMLPFVTVTGTGGVIS